MVSRKEQKHEKFYYCEIEATSYGPERLAELEAVDLEQWDALLHQSNIYGYDPFDLIKIWQVSIKQ